MANWKKSNGYKCKKEVFDIIKSNVFAKFQNIYVENIIYSFSS